MKEFRYPTIEQVERWERVIETEFPARLAQVMNQTEPDDATAWCTESTLNQLWFENEALLEPGEGTDCFEAIFPVIHRLRAYLDPINVANIVRYYPRFLLRQAENIETLRHFPNVDVEADMVYCYASRIEQCIQHEFPLQHMDLAAYAAKQPF
jgi:hypothetical protein